MCLFKDNLIKEYSDFKKANPDTFNWWSYVNMKNDLQTALGICKVFLSGNSGGINITKVQ